VVSSTYEGPTMRKLLITLTIAAPLLAAA